MVGPTTEYLAGQLDKLREEISSGSRVVDELRQATLDEIRGLKDATHEHLGDVHLGMIERFDMLQREVHLSKEAVVSEQTTTRMDVARLQEQTGQLITRFDRALSLMRLIFVALIGVSATVLGAAAAGIWNGSRVYYAVEQHAGRIEKLETRFDAVDTLRSSIDRVQQTLDARPAAVR